MPSSAPPIQPDGEVVGRGADEIILSRRNSGDTTDRFQLRGDGRMLFSNGSTAPAPMGSGVAARQPTTGIFTAPIELARDTVTQTSQQMNLALFQAEQSMTVTNIGVAVGSTAAAATPTLIRFGIYTISGTTATLAISTTNDTTLLATINVWSSKAVTTPTAITRGTSYYLAVLVVTGATAPILASRNAGGVTTAHWDSAFGSGLRLAGNISSQADLPASFTTTNITTTTTSAVLGWLT